MKEREAVEQAKAEMEAKRRMIAAAKGRFVSVTFTKKDGSERVMRVGEVEVCDRGLAK